jgi:hypothetical protein
MIFKKYLTKINIPGYTDALLGLVRLGLLSAEQHPSVHPQAR